MTESRSLLEQETIANGNPAVAVSEVETIPEPAKPEAVGVYHQSETREDQVLRWLPWLLFMLSGLVLLYLLMQWIV